MRKSDELIRDSVTEQQEAAVQVSWIRASSQG